MNQGTLKHLKTLISQGSASSRESWQLAEEDEEQERENFGPYN